jgi:hypothetical protein
MCIFSSLLMTPPYPGLYFGMLTVLHGKQALRSHSENRRKASPVHPSIRAGYETAHRWADASQAVHPLIPRLFLILEMEKGPPKKNEPFSMLDSHSSQVPYPVDLPGLTEIKRSHGLKALTNI